MLITESLAFLIIRRILMNVFGVDVVSPLRSFDRNSQPPLTIVFHWVVLFFELCVFAQQPTNAYFFLPFLSMGSATHTSESWCSARSWLAILAQLTQQYEKSEKMQDFSWVVWDHEIIERKKSSCTDALKGRAALISSLGRTTTECLSLGSLSGFPSMPASVQSRR